MTRFFEIRKKNIRFSRHANISCNRTHNCNNQKQYKISCRKQDNDLADVLKYQKSIMIQNCNVIHLVCIYQCFFVNQQIRNHRIQKIQEINHYKMIYIRAIFHQNIQKRDQAHSCNQYKSCSYSIKSAEHSHQDLLFLDIISCNRSIKSISDCSSDP